MCKIVIAEDNTEIAKLVQQYLELQGHVVSVADNGTDAIALITNDTTVVVSDINMPGVSGTEVLKYGTEHGAKGIVMTGGLVVKTSEDIPYPVLLKPFSLDELTDVINEVLK